VARGGYRPRIDLTAGIGRERLDPPAGATLHYTRSGATLSLTQMLYDGLANRSEVEKMGYARLVRYYEVLDISESTALESVRAHADVLRFRELMAQARENYVQHKLLFDQVKQRADSGVGRRVDHELAGGRLALAESNLLTEAANLHDVSARYQRLVGELPAEALGPVLLDIAAAPENIAEAIKLAYSGNPAFNAATENIRAAQAELNGRDARFRPRLDFRAREDLGRNIDGVAGSRANQVVELLLNFNLYNGGSDAAAKRQFAQRLNLAKDLRDKTCRDIRQTLVIAHNDITRLNEQLDYLGQHQNAIAKARIAYRQQFEIGQRTLLDLLDIQNEYFQARRAHISAAHELGIAQARTLAGMGRLLVTLQISRDGMPMAEEAASDRAGRDPAEVCPAEAPGMARFDKQAILDEALKSGAAVPFVSDRPAQPTATQPSPQSSATAALGLAKTYKLSDDWFTRQNPNHYVLQMLRAKSAQDIDAFVSKHDLNGCHTYTKQHNAQAAHVLTCGLYPSGEAAEKAAARMPKKLRSFDLIPIRIEDILKSAQS
jgi:adhesin transport system outer membrane protein